MPKRIILHPGFHKTGTTSVQRFLRLNRAALRPYVALRLRWHLKNLLFATRKYATDRDALDLVKVHARFGRVLHELPDMPRRTLLFAAEELLGHLPGRGTLADYSAAPELLYGFCESLKTQFPQAEIVIYLSTRAQSPWLASAYWEHVKSSSLTMDYDGFVARYAQAAELDAMAAEIAARVPARLETCALEVSRDLPFGPATPLLDLCEIPAPLRKTLQVEPAANVQGTAEALAKMLDVNRNTKGAQRRNRLKAAILKEAGLA
ncbi:MAG: hypothetical protein AAF943_06575 [Pseudomonadota bacterium]